MEFCCDFDGGICGINIKRSLKDPPMFVNTGGGGKGIRPNQHNQQQQQQAQQQQQLHHQTHHQAIHQSQQHQQQQQLQVGSLVHHTQQQQTSSQQQSTGGSHPHPHQQPVAQHQQQQQFQHQQVPLAFFSYPLSQIHPSAATQQQHQHSVQTSVGNNVGGASQMAPSPPIHAGGGGNGSQQQQQQQQVVNSMVSGSGLTTVGGGGGGNNPNNPNNMGGNRQQQQQQQQGNNSQSLPSHYTTGSALMQASLPPPNSNHFMTSAYHMQLQQQNTAVMVAQYNSAAAAAVAAAGGGGQAGHALYQTPQQAQAPPQTHQQQTTIHSGQPTLHYFPNPGVSAGHAPTQLHHHPPPHHQLRNMLTAAVTHPRQPYLVSQGSYFTLSHATLPPPPRTSLLTNVHQQSTAAAAAASGVGATGGVGGGSTVHVATQLQNTATRGTAPTGPTTYVSSPFCTPPLQMAAGGTPIASQPTSMLAAASTIGPSQLPTPYSHLGGLPTASTSTTSLNIQSTIGGGVTSSTSIGTEYKGSKPRKHAIPIIDPVTLEKVTFGEPQKKSTAVEVRPPPPPLPTAALLAEEQSQSKTVRAMAEIENVNETVNETVSSFHMENDKSITASVANAPTTPPPASLTPSPPPPLPVATRDKIDQQMQTDAVKEKPSTTSMSNTTTPRSDDEIQSLKTGESLQTCIEDPDDTDADTNEHELDNEDDDVDLQQGRSLEQRTTTCASYMDRELTTNLNITQEEIINKTFEVQTPESDTEDHTTETEVKSTTSQIDDAKDEELPIETTFPKQDTTIIYQQISSQTSLEHSYEGLEVKEAQTVNTAHINTNEVKESFKESLEHKEQDILDEKPSSLSDATYRNEQKNITTSTSTSINVSSSKNKDQIKSVNTANSAVTSSNSGNIKSKSKQNNVAAPQKPINATQADSSNTSSRTNQQSNVQNPSTSGNATSTNNNNNIISSSNAFITVGKGKNRKMGKRTKENQKKSQQQQQQQKFHEPSSVSASASNQRSGNTATSNNNSNNNKNSNNNNTNTNNLSLSSNASTNILLTDIHNANSSSISSSISGNLREQQQQQNKQQNSHHQQQQQQTSRTHNNRNASGGGQSKGIDSKNETENQRKHVKTQEIVAQILQPKVSQQENSKDDEQQIQFLNSSSSTCEDEDTTRPQLEQEQQKEVDAAIDVHFGDFKEDEKLIETNTTPPATTFSTKGSQNKQKNLPTTTDTVDCSSNLPPPSLHTSRGGVATSTTIHSKSHKGHHNIAPTGAGTIHKHKANKQQHQPLIRYSLDELKALAISPESRKTPVVRCQGDCVSQLFVSSQAHHPHHSAHHGGGGGHNAPAKNLHLQQQYQHMNFNESMEFVTGKRRGGGGGGQTRKHHDQHANTTAAGSINAGIAMLPGSSASTNAAQFPRKMEVIRIHLSLNEEIKLSECENAWQPEPLRSKSNHTSPSAGPNDDIDAVLKKVRGILNKLTPDNFDVLLKTMTSISMNTQEKMQQVMLLIFEKTVSEPNFAPTYAKFCKVLFQEIKPESRKMFNASLIKRIQTEFEVNVNDADAKKLKLQPLVDKMEAATDAKERNELQAEIEDQEYQFRRRAWGTVRFIGEMYKLQSLTGDRVLLCIESLLEHGSEEKLEYMCKLLTTVGHLLEGNGTEHYANNLRMDKIFRKIQDIVNEAKASAKSMGGNASSSTVTNAKTGVQTRISSRVRFMMQDVIDLRSRNWDQVSSSTNTTKSTHGSAQTTGSTNVTSSQQPQQQQQQQSQQQHRRNHRHQDDKNHQSSSGSSGNYERGGAQRMGGYANNNQRPSRLMMQQDMRDGGSSGGGNYFMQKPLKSQYLAQQEQQSIDLKKLNFSRGDDSSKSTTTLGNQSIYMWRNVAGRPTSQNSNTGLQQNNSANQPSLGGTQTSHYMAGNKGQQGGSNSMTSRNSFKRQTSNQFQVLSFTRDSEMQQNSEMEKVSSVTAVSSGSNNASDEDDKSFMSYYSSEKNQKLLNLLIEEYLDCLTTQSDSWQALVLTTWQNTTQKQQCCLVYYILMDYLHLAVVKKVHRNACSAIFSYLLRCKDFEKKTFARAYEQFAEEFPDLLVDVPNGWTYVFEFLGPLLHERLLSFSDVWQPNWREDRHFTEKFVNALIAYFTKEFGANYVRDLWHNEYKLDRGQLFMADHQQWREFIQKHNLQYIYDNTKPPQTKQRDNSRNTAGAASTCSTLSSVAALQEQQVKRLEMLLKTANDCDLAIDYINTNVSVNNNFLRNLTQFLCCDYAAVIINTSSSTTATTTTITSSNSSRNSSSSSSCSVSSRSRPNANSKKDPRSMDTSSSSVTSNRSHLNADLFRKNCLPLLRLCLDAQEDYEVTCLDAVVDSIQQYHDIHSSNELICGIFDILYDCEVIAKESFEKWYRQRQQDEYTTTAGASAAATNNKYNKKPLTGHLKHYMQKLL